MSDDTFTLHLKQLLADVDKSMRVFAAEQAHYRRIARRQTIQLTVGRIKIDAARAALEARHAARRSGGKI